MKGNLNLLSITFSILMNTFDLSTVSEGFQVAGVDLKSALLATLNHRNNTKQAIGMAKNLQHLLQEVTCWPQQMMRFQ